MKTTELPRGLTLTAAVSPDQERILSPEALAFFAELHRQFNPRRLELLRRRVDAQQALDRGELPTFPPETESIRDGEWKVSPVPLDFRNRRVEITGPVDKKMVINALNSGAQCYMADFEDSHSPTWKGTLEGQLNLYEANRGTLGFTSPEGKAYRLNQKTATLIVRPRGWHLPEKHVLVNGQAASASLFDFALYFFHNARERLARGSGVDRKSVV